MTTAFLAIDVQNALCKGKWAAFDVEGVVERINGVAAKARGVGAPVVFIQHEEEHEAMRFDSAGWQLHEGLDVQPQDRRVRKTTCDAFFKTELRQLLADQGISRLIVSGMQSEFCVDSTVRSALAHGFPVVLVSDGHTTLDNGVLRAAQITAHHNITLSHIGGYGPSVTVVPASEIRVES